MSFAGYFLPVLFCMLSMLISDSRFDLVWFRLSCDHGWIRSGSVNVRKQQQQQQYLLGYYTNRYRTTLYKIVSRISSTFVENNGRSLGNDGAWVVIRRENGQIVSCREGLNIAGQLSGGLIMRPKAAKLYGNPFFVGFN